jgi:hypothetical protein
MSSLSQTDTLATTGATAPTSAWTSRKLSNTNFSPSLRKLDDAVNFVFRPDLTRPTLSPQSGDIYLLKGSTLYKIGKSIQTDKRKKRLEKQVSEKLELLHTIKSNDYTRAEVTLHQRYEHLHRHGEWFELGPAEVAEILQIGEMNF